MQDGQLLQSGGTRGECCGHVIDSSSKPVVGDSGEPEAINTPRLGNRPELTGLRAPLIIVLLVGHTDIHWVPGGWAVLSVWFAISGFLITGILLREKAVTGKVYLGKFYARRALRLYPTLWVVIACLYVYVFFVHSYAGWHKLNAGALSVVLFYIDYQEAFRHASGGVFFGPLWTIAVEEQFYLVWAPLLTFAAWRWGRKAVLWIAILGFVASTVDREVIWFTLGQSLRAATRIYPAFDTRADALFAGCILGVLFTSGALSRLSRQRQRMLFIGAGTSTLMYVLVIALVPAGTAAPYIWGLTLTALLGVIIIMHLVANPNGRYARLLRVRALVHIGEISYVIYVVHWPIYSLLNSSVVPSMDIFELLLVRVVVVIAISELLWRLVERNVTKLRHSRLFAAGDRSTAISNPLVNTSTE